ncbi:MAG: hypothetical protein V9H26_10935 [Verrucomicrobiota bacterium]|nr:hypothetical protein [Verrucomicrobiota bacterium]MCC6820907.1 hypothetical protein [Limisphaerales bacterium]
MKKPPRAFIIIAASLMLTSGLLLATSPGHRTRQRPVRLHSRNSIATFSFSISTNALASVQRQTQ